MKTLFDITPELPQGFSYYPNFITPAEEKALTESIEKLELQAMKFHQYEAKRKVLGFGRGWSFTEHQLKQGNPMPVQFDPLLDKIAEKLVIAKEMIAQFLVTAYPPGAVINWHRDAPPFNMIAGVSLLADCNFKLRPHDKAKRSGNATISLEVERRSLYIMQGPAKTEWQHSTTPLKTLRYSLTCRTLK
jgi:alkylated DNA repair dioxygenase AlkB